MTANCLFIHTTQSTHNIMIYKLYPNNYNCTPLHL